jgi:hypothetical protein
MDGWMISRFTLTSEAPDLRMIWHEYDIEKKKKKKNQSVISGGNNLQAKFRHPPRWSSVIDSSKQGWSSLTWSASKQPFFFFWTLTLDTDLPGLFPQVRRTSVLCMIPHSLLSSMPFWSADPISRRRHLPNQPVRIYSVSGSFASLRQTRLAGINDPWETRS